MIRRALNALDLIRGLFFYTNPIESPEAAEWRRQDRTRLENAPGLDPDALGKLIAAGLQHRIYEYTENGEPMVLKLAIPTRWLRFPTAQEAQEDVQLVSRFFKPYAVSPTEVIPLPDGTGAVKQRRLYRLRPITRRDMGDLIRNQFLDIAGRNRELIEQAGRSLDFLGREGQRKSRAALIGFSQTPTIANLVIEKQPDGSERIRIVDTDLENFRRGARSLRDWRSSLAARLAVAINRWLIRRFFDIDILNP